MESKSSNQPPAPNAPASETNGLAVAALVTGLLGFGIIPIILGVLGLKKPGGRGMSIAGIVLGILSVLAWIGIIILIMIGAFAADSVTDNIRDYQEEQQAEYEDKFGGKRDFAKGETAKFGNLEVTIDKVTRNFVPANEFSRADEGKELIVLDITIKNVGDESEFVSSSTFDVEENGLGVGRHYATPPAKELDSGNLATDGTMSGQVVYEVTANAQNLKLTTETYTYNPSSSQSEKVKFTLAF